ncbi:unnamed protein product [Blepharisma stoltei]|uniref:Uncharacterized protein n=1 Tax=Blepharisma stoltei TaxID=1481888 RepID=A0AAU9JN80_9CILI|nr:unnamed protein product [Blepharisma stoltei]
MNAIQGRDIPEGIIYNMIRKNSISKTPPNLSKTFKAASIPSYLLEDLPNYQKRRNSKSPHSSNKALIKNIADLELRLFLKESLCSNSQSRKGELTDDEKKFQSKIKKYRELFADDKIKLKKDKVVYDSPRLGINKSSLPKLKQLSEFASVGKLKGDLNQQFQDIQYIDHYFYKKAKELTYEKVDSSPLRNRKKSVVGILGRNKTPTNVILNKNLGFI